MWSTNVDHFNIDQYMMEPRRGRKQLSLPKGTAIFFEGDSNDSVFFVLEGSVKLTISSHSGKEVIVSMIDGGHFFGESCVVNGFPLRTYKAVALSDVRVIRFNRAAMIDLLQSNEDLLYCFLRGLMRSVETLQESLSSSFLYPAGKRLARILVSLSRLAGDPRVGHGVPRLRQEELAQMIGSTRQHVNTNLMKLKKKGHVQYERGLKNFKVKGSMSSVAGYKSS